MSSIRIISTLSIFFAFRASSLEKLIMIISVMFVLTPVCGQVLIHKGNTIPVVKDHVYLKTTSDIHVDHWEFKYANEEVWNSIPASNKDSIKIQAAADAFYRVFYFDPECPDTMYTDTIHYLTPEVWLENVNLNPYHLNFINVSNSFASVENISAWIGNDTIPLYRISNTQFGFTPPESAVSYSSMNVRVYNSIFALSYNFHESRNYSVEQAYLYAQNYIRELKNMIDSMLIVTQQAQDELADSIGVPGIRLPVVNTDSIFNIIESSIENLTEEELIEFVKALDNPALEPEKMLTGISSDNRLKSLNPTGYKSYSDYDSPQTPEERLAALERRLMNVAQNMRLCTTNIGLEFPEDLGNAITSLNEKALGVFNTVKSGFDLFGRIMLIKYIAEGVNLVRNYKYIPEEKFIINDNPASALIFKHGEARIFDLKIKYRNIINSDAKSPYLNEVNNALKEFNEQYGLALEDDFIKKFDQTVVLISLVTPIPNIGMYYPLDYGNRIRLEEIVPLDFKYLSTTSELLQESIDNSSIEIDRFISEGNQVSLTFSNKGQSDQSFSMELEYRNGSTYAFRQKISAKIIGNINYKVSYYNGNSQSGIPGKYLDHPIQVKVTDDEGNPQEDIKVVFSLGEESHGKLGSDVVNTDNEGIAGTTWQLPDRYGQFNVIARVYEPVNNVLINEKPLTFWARTVTGEPATIEIVKGNYQHGSPGEVLAPLLFYVKDKNNLPCNDCKVSYTITGGGELQITSQATDANGNSFTLWALGTCNKQELTASVYNTKGEKVDEVNVTAFLNVKNPVIIDADISRRLNRNYFTGPMKESVLSFSFFDPDNNSVRPYIPYPGYTGEILYNFVEIFISGCSIPEYSNREFRIFTEDAGGAVYQTVYPEDPDRCIYYAASGVIRFSLGDWIEFSVMDEEGNMSKPVRYEYR